MEANERRRIRSGREFDHLFPPPGEQDTTVKRQAGVDDTMALIQKTVPLTLWHTEKMAKVLKARTLEETCRNIWHFVYNHIQYQRDKDGVEQVRSPRRTWHERETGVDCDCYTEFISSILLNLNIPHKARITKYPKKFPVVPRWQHVYPIVPKAGRWHKAMNDRDDYIVIDCVKNDFDDEQPYLECKDYDMRLDYLDGIEEEETQNETINFIEPDSVDLVDLASISDDEEMGKLFKKVGKALKKTVKKVGTAAKKVGTVAKKVGDKVGQGIRVLNRYTNPATILLRNGFLLAMKINLLNVAGRLRYAYLTDAQAQAKGINPNELKKLRFVKDRAETVYWQAGGKKANLKKAILKGKGNKDKKVPLSGFEGLEGLEEVYNDYDEYNIINSDGLEGLGEVASGTAIAAATSAVAAIAGALAQVKGLFSKGGKDEQSFQSQTDNAGTEASAPATVPEDEDAFTYDEVPSAPEPSEPSSFVSKVTSAITAPKPEIIKQVVQSFAPQSVMPPNPAPAPSASIQPQVQQTITESFDIQNETPQDYSAPAQDTQPVLSTESAARRAVPVPTESTTASTLQTTKENPSQKEGFLQKTGEWVKKNPGKTLLVAGGIAVGGYLVAKALSGRSKTNGLNGTPKQQAAQPSYGKQKKNKKKNHKVKRQILL